MGLHVKVVCSRVTIISCFRAGVRVVGYRDRFFYGSSYLLGGLSLRRRANNDRYARVLGGKYLVRVTNAIHERVCRRVPHGATRSSRASYVLSHVVQVGRLYSSATRFQALARSGRFFRPIQVSKFCVVVRRGRVFSLYVHHDGIVSNEVVGFFSPSRGVSLPISKGLFVVSGGLVDNAIVLRSCSLGVLVANVLLRRFRANLGDLFLIFI